MNKYPNIIFILTDDQGSWALGCNDNAELHTPNIDSLAQNGIVFDQFFCTSPVCSPARASILTGKIPSQHGVHDWIRSGNLAKECLAEKINDPYYRSENKAIPYLENQITYTDILQNHGYHCALSGKWHLGDSLSPQHGFSDWFTIARGGCLYYKADVVENGQISYSSDYITDVITNKALDYIDKLSEKNSPYYLSVHYTAPHDPWDGDQHPKEYLDLYANCAFDSVPNLPIHENQIPSAPIGVGEERKRLLRGYYSAITAMDANVGRIIEKVKECGDLENTIIVFTSDNGMNMGHHGIWGKGNGTFPFNMYDTAVKVPFIISYPAKLKSNQRVNSLHSHYDWIHTLLELLEISTDILPTNLPGKSFVPALNSIDNSDDSIVILDEYGPTRMIRTKEWKYIKRYPYGPDELYDLTIDKDEMHNLIEDKTYEHILLDLKKRMETWFLQYVNPSIDGAKEGVTGSGQLAKAGIHSDLRYTYAIED